MVCIVSGVFPSGFCSSPRGEGVGAGTNHPRVGGGEIFEGHFLKLLIKREMGVGLVLVEETKKFEGGHFQTI